MCDFTHTLKTFKADENNAKIHLINMKYAN